MTNPKQHTADNLNATLPKQGMVGISPMITDTKALRFSKQKVYILYVIGRCRGIMGMIWGVERVRLMDTSTGVRLVGCWARVGSSPCFCRVAVLLGSRLSFLIDGFRSLKRRGGFFWDGRGASRGLGSPCDSYIYPSAQS